MLPGSLCGASGAVFVGRGVRSGWRARESLGWWSSFWVVRDLVVVMAVETPAWRDFVAWYRTEHPRLTAVVMGMTGEFHLSQEVADEAFARAWLHWRRVRSMDRPSGWLYRTAVNELRRRRRRAALESAVLRRERPETHVTPPAAAVELWELVAALPERQRRCVVLRYVAGLPEADIAGAMGVTRSTVSSALTAARRSLGSALADDPMEVRHD